MSPVLTRGSENETFGKSSALVLSLVLNFLHASDESSSLK